MQNCDQEKAGEEKPDLYWRSWSSWNKQVCFQICNPFFWAEDLAPKTNWTQ